MTTHVSSEYDPTSIQSMPSLRHTTLTDLVHRPGHGRFTSEDLIRALLARVDQVNDEFHAVIELNSHIEEDARLLDLEYKARGPRGPLHGVPILLKDNIPTLDGTETTCGSLALVGAKPPKEAAVVTALRDAAAIVLGKANMAEWSGFRSTSGCSGWSPRGG
ncbi:amidase signature domain-containing protein [Paraphoma chrysanthemicola]|nr:amidase signature domain-containing protein [Paraphoma chrysanthemicola]